MRPVFAAIVSTVTLAGSGALPGCAEPQPRPAPAPAAYAEEQHQQHVSSKAPWKEFAPANGRCTVLLPGAPVLQDQRLDTADGPITLHAAVFTSKKSDKRVFLVSWSDRIPDAKESEEQLLAKVIAVHGLGARAPGAAGEMTLASRTLRAGERIYQLVACGPSSESGSRDASKFLESFKVTEGSVR